MCKCHFWKTLGVFTLLAAIAAVLWYGSLTESQKSTVKNFVQQIPDLPGRFMV